MDQEVTAPNWDHVNLLMRGVLACADQAQAARLWQQEVDGRPLWQWAASWALWVALRDMEQQPQQQGIRVKRFFDDGTELSVTCAEHTGRCPVCGGSGGLGKNYERPCLECEGTGTKHVTLGECGCPTFSEQHPELAEVFDRG